MIGPGSHTGMVGPVLFSLSRVRSIRGDKPVNVITHIHNREDIYSNKQLRNHRI